MQRLCAFQLIAILGEYQKLGAAFGSNSLRCELEPAKSGESIIASRVESKIFYLALQDSVSYLDVSAALRLELSVSRIPTTTCTHSFSISSAQRSVICAVQLTQVR